MKRFCHYHTIRQYIIDKLYKNPDGPSISSSLRNEPFAVLFWALGIVLAHILKQLTQPAGQASFNSGTGTAVESQVRLDLRRVGPLPFPILLHHLSTVCISSRRCGGLVVRVPASRLPVLGSNLGLGPPHSVG